MKAKLLKTIRKDKRFWIYKQGEIKGYPDSGWWHLYDIKLSIYLRRKKLSETLEEYVRFMRLRNRVRVCKLIVLGSVLFMVLIMCSCSSEPVEVWNPYSSDVSGDSTAIFIDSITDSDQEDSCNACMIHKAYGLKNATPHYKQ